MATQGSVGVNGESVSAVLARAAAADPLGHSFHLVLALAWAFFFPFEMMPGAKDILMGALAVMCVSRIAISGIGYAWAPLCRGPLLWLMLGWLAWTLASAAWSPVPQWGIEEAKSLRALIMPLLVFPVLAHPGRLIVAFLAGVATINIGQVTQAVGLGLLEPKQSDRFAAWGSPNPLGLIFAVAIVMHVSLLITIRKRGQAGACLLGLVLAILGLAFTYNRGGIIAAMVTVPLIVLAACVLRPRTMRTCLAVITAILVGTAAAWWIDDAFLESRGSAATWKRWDHFVQEFRGEGDYAMRPVNRRSIGARLVSWNAMRDAAIEHPIIGTGAGGLAASLESYPGIGPTNPDGTLTDSTTVQFQPHSSWLWTLAATGLVGLALMVATIGWSLVKLIMRISSDPMAMAFMAGLVVWCVGNVFDTLLISGSTTALLMLPLLGAVAIRIETQAR